MRKRLVVTIDTEPMEATVPEVKLYAALLERAVRDLTDPDPIVVHQTINWFNGRVKKALVTFESVQAILNLSGTRLTYIDKQLQEAKANGNQCVQKRKACRTRASSLPKGPRL